MKSIKPTLISIDHDEYHASDLGWTSDGRQFFLTTPFIPKSDTEEGCEFAAMYVFDKDGRLIDYKIESFGPRATYDRKKRDSRLQEWFTSLGDVSFERIDVIPFSVTYAGVEFGFVIRVPESDDDVWAVELQPGNYMAFFEPWDSGIYDT
jgi:hypothetical protein